MGYNMGKCKVIHYRWTDQKVEYDFNGEILHIIALQTGLDVPSKNDNIGAALN